MRTLSGGLSNTLNILYFAEDCSFSRDLFLKHTEQKKMLKAKKKNYLTKILFTEAAYTKHPGLEVNC